MPERTADNEGEKQIENRERDCHIMEDGNSTLLQTMFMEL